MKTIVGMLIFGVLIARKSNNVFIIINSLWHHVQTSTRQTVEEYTKFRCSNKFCDTVCNGMIAL